MMKPRFIIVLGGFRYDDCAEGLNVTFHGKPEVLSGQLSEPDLEEVEKIKDTLMPDEKVLLVVRQSRIAPRGLVRPGTITTPNTIFATNRRIVIRNPTMLGLRAGIEDFPYNAITSVKLHKGVFSSEIRLRIPGLTETSRLRTVLRWGRRDEGEIQALPKDKAEQLVTIMKEGVVGRLPGQTPLVSTAPVATVSPLDEIKKLAELKDAGLITEEEFEEKKKKLLEKI